MGLDSLYTLIKNHNGRSDLLFLSIDTGHLTNPPCGGTVVREIRMFQIRQELIHGCGFGPLRALRAPLTIWAIRLLPLPQVMEQGKRSVRHDNLRTYPDKAQYPEGTNSTTDTDVTNNNRKPYPSCTKNNHQCRAAICHWNTTEESTGCTGTIQRT